MLRKLMALACLGGLFGVALAGGADDPANAVTVKEVRADAFKAAIEGAKGKVVVVDCWATWCVPCVKKFPHLVELHKKYADKGLVCVSLSMDKVGDEDDYKPEKVLKFLKDKGATFPNFIVAEPRKDEEAMAKVIGDFSAIPYMAVFDRTGKRVWTSDQKLTDEQLDKLIEEQLAEKK
jgi:thiol-disulfide isomerase/thioredoxin